MTERTPPAGYEPLEPAPCHAYFYLQEQMDYDGVTPLYMVMQADSEGKRILAERCLPPDGMVIVDALRLHYSITNWGTP